MGIEQIRMNQTKALPPVPQFNWSQIESICAKSQNDSSANLRAAIHPPYVTWVNREFRPESNRRMQ